MSEKLSASFDGGALTREQIHQNFNDLHPPLTKMQAMVEADRCLYCYDAPCIRACPTSIDIPTFIHQIRTDNPIGSAKTILDANIMGGTCARVCPTEELCEEACVRNTSEDQPIQIGALQRHAVDALMQSDMPHPFTRGETSGKRVAIVGAGPAGLACAHRLARLGHACTVFDAKDKAGGLNEYGLAAYKMVSDFAQREVDFIAEVGGIDLRFGHKLGEDTTLAALQDEFDAVFLGIGLGDTNDPGIEGRDLAGVEDAIDFIEALRQCPDPADMPVGEEVIVIGGGNTAVDAAVQAKRLGADMVTLAYRRGEAHMSATEWEQELAATNGVTIRHWVKPVSFNGEDAVESVTFERSRLSDTGALEGSGKTFTLPADQVLLAVGQTLNDAALSGLKMARGKIDVNADFATSMNGVFAGGDCVTSGSDLTVQAVEDGKCAAVAIHRYLGGDEALLAGVL